MKRLLLILLVFTAPLNAAFYSASYEGCDPVRLGSIYTLYIQFLGALDESGDTLAGHDFFTFPNRALTVLAVLSESHASIDSHPEEGSCRVFLSDGDRCDWRRVEAAMVAYLKPDNVDRDVVEIE